MPPSGSIGASALSAALTQRCRRSATDLPRRVAVADRLAQNALATLPTWDVHDWLESWPVLALACGLSLDAVGKPCVPSPSQLCKRWQAAGAPPFETLFVLTVWRAVRCHLIGARDLIINSAPILAWRRTDPDAATGHAPAHHPRPRLVWLPRPYPALSCSGLPVHFLLSPANRHDALFARPLLRTGRSSLSHSSSYHSPGCWLLGPSAHSLDPRHAGSQCGRSLESQATKEPHLTSASAGPKKIWVKAVQLNASLAWSSSSSGCLGLPTRAGRPSSSKWP